MKPTFKKGELKGKGLDKQKEPPCQTKPDHRMRYGAERPLIKLNWGDRWNQFTMWFQGFVIDATGLIIKKAIPGWFWIALIIGIMIVLLVSL